jgi:hypothetical protein
MVFLAITNNKPYGFVVLQPIAKSLHEWAAWSSINDELLLQEAWQEVLQMAKQDNKTKVTFTSQRRGWDKKAIKMGLRPSTWEYTL